MFPRFEYLKWQVYRLTSLKASLDQVEASAAERSACCASSISKFISSVVEHSRLSAAACPHR